jgi:uncharacterized protein (DUF433 family)
MQDENAYVEMRDDRYAVRGHRVPLTALAALWRDGASPETIRENYPSLTMAQILGSLAFYLEHQEEIDSHVLEDEATFQRLRAEDQATHPDRVAEWQRRLAAVRARP